MFSSLPVFSKAGFQAAPAARIPVETAKEVVTPVCKALVDFSAGLVAIG